jgi:N-acetyl-gamma-glutamylphosphate reductase
LSGERRSESKTSRKHNKDKERSSLFRHNNSFPYPLFSHRHTTEFEVAQKQYLAMHQRERCRWEAAAGRQRGCFSASLPKSLETQWPRIL